MLKQKIEEFINFIENIKNNNISKILDFLKWFKEKLKLEFKYKYSNFIPNKWEIYFINLWKNIWSELNKNRPCIIYSNYFLNRWDTVLIIPLKSYKWYKNNNINIIIKNSKLNWLKKDSIIDLMWIKQVSKKRINKIIWKLEKEYLEKTDKKLLKILNIKK